MKSGQSRRAAARRYTVSASFAVKPADRMLRTGWAPHLAALPERIEVEPAITMLELAANRLVHRAGGLHARKSQPIERQLRGRKKAALLGRLCVVGCGGAQPA